MTNAWVVVLNWHGRTDTLEVLADLDASDVSIVVVDNGSYDGTLEEVGRRYPRMQTIQTGRNLGYAGGNNAGIEFAVAHGADVVGVLNNDTRVPPGALRPLLSELEATFDVAVSPDIRYADNVGKSWFRGGVLQNSAGWPGYLLPEDQPPVGGPPVSTPVLSGCCIFARVETWKSVGLFDESLFLIFEDFDWCRRAAARGVDLRVVPRSVIHHKVSRSFRGPAGTLGSYYFSRNGVIFAARHLSIAAVLRFVVLQVLRQNAKLLLSSKDWRPAVAALLGLIAALLGSRGPAGPVVTRVAGRASTVEETIGDSKEGS